jgi:hypothetical protein
MSCFRGQLPLFSGADLREVKQMAGASGQWTALRSLGSAFSPNLEYAPASLSSSARRTWIAALAVLVSVIASCGADNDEHPPPAGEGGASSGVGGWSGHACEEGETQECHATLGQQGNVLSCIKGTQICLNGRWSACTDGEYYSRIVPPDGSTSSSAAADETQGGVRPLSLSDAGPCMNPCDPTCQVFAEVPLGGAAIALTPWTTGSLIGLQNSIWSPFKYGYGYKQPCSTAADCEFNQRCDYPDSGTCSHHKCTVGAALATGCDSCVTQICNADPTCCNSTWSQSCVDKVHDVCGAFCVDPWPNQPPPPSTCVHDRCYSGPALNAGCDPCVGQICADPALAKCCSGGWDIDCVSAVTTVCGTSCPIAGSCDPWVAGETDTRCTGADLTVGISCQKPIPSPTRLVICNVGTQVAPKGVKVVAYPSGTVFNGGSQVQDRAWGYSGAWYKDFGVTSEPIAPGGCINLIVDPAATPPLPALSPGDEIRVNPPGAGQVPECQYRDNWSIYTQNIVCEPLTCSGEQPGSESGMPAMYIAVDRSNANSPSNWSAIQTGLDAFFQNNTSRVNGVNISLGFFPDKNGAGNDCNAATCNEAQCNARVAFPPPWAPLINVAPPLDTLEASVVSTMDSMGIDTLPPPTGAALQGAYRQAKAYRVTWANLARNVAPVTVLVLSGEPAACNPASPPPASLSTPVQLAGLASTKLAEDNIKTYVIGVGPSISKATVNLIASAGGGKGYYFPSSTSLSANITSALLDIRDKIFPCVFPLPTAGVFDVATAELNYLPGNTTGKATPITKYNDASQCGPVGWYYDDNLNPKNVILCPQTCIDANTYDPNWSTKLPFVRLVLQCPAEVKTQLYTGICPAGSKVQWSYLSWDASTPTGTSIMFKGRTASTIAELPSVPSLTLATAQLGPPNTQQCPLGSACAVDLYNAFNGPPAALQDYLEIQLTLTQNLTLALTPALRSWNVTYSCPPSE